MKRKRKQLSFAVPKAKPSKGSKPSKPSPAPKQRSLSFAQVAALRDYAHGPLNAHGAARHFDMHTATVSALRLRGFIAWDAENSYYSITRAGRMELARHDKRAELAARVQLALPFARCA